ncbi:MAG: heavy metal translocating P-type ATPase, partial [Deltaproteobacteria bacterium]|nr:heavy metal translocating P-type ATPase [Deltaproteobacteria bacterium]
MSRSPSPIPKASEASRQQIFIALGALVGIVGYLVSHYGFAYSNSAFLLIAVILLGGIPLLLSLAKKAWAGEFGADFLAGISICTALLLQEYLAGAIIVLMLSGGEALESFAIRRASSVL